MNDNLCKLILLTNLAVTLNLLGLICCIEGEYSFLTRVCLFAKNHLTTQTLAL
jgi:hypothetical protein